MAERPRRLRRFLVDPKNFFSILILIAFAVTAVLPNQVLPHDPTRQNLRARLQPPTWVSGGTPEHLLGTDNLGRDVLARVMRGARATFVTVLLSAVAAAVLGSALGLLAGFYRGWVDEVISRLIDVQLAFPTMLLMIAVVGLLGQGLWVLVGTLALAVWPAYARLMRAAVLGLRDLDFVAASRALGTPDAGLILRHIAPNTVSSMIVFTTFQLSQLLLIESALSFLGLGVPPPATSWGAIIASGRAYLLDGWWVAALPGLAIIFVVLAFNFLGDGLRDLLDPRQR
ncbi:MAG TPA: ABC transporter permease [Trueperaceae bacterium]|nr:ABC transporter permease [Trueperaceae bacterium]HRP45906.1 ABC transporter permease [Trueperaceae bacterium]